MNLFSSFTQLLPFVSYTKVSTDGKIIDIDGFVYQIILNTLFGRKVSV